MALGTYTPVYNTYQLANKVEAISLEISSLEAADYFESLKSQLRNQIKKLKDKEEAMYKHLHVSDAAALNKRLADYRNATLNFNGARLQEEIIQILREKNAKDWENFRAGVTEILTRELGQNIDDYINERGLDQFFQSYLNLLNKEKNTSSTSKFSKYTEFRSTKGLVDSHGHFNLVKVTPEQRKRWEKIINEPTTDIDFSGGTASFNWFEVIKNNNTPMTPLEAAKLDDEEPGRIDDINNTIKQKIVSMASQDQDIIAQIIDYILTVNRYEFFSGKNTNAIIGTFGEIQGMYFLAKFLGADKIGTILEWRGGSIDKKIGQKPHQDILFEELFGVQVKNTTRDDIPTIDFADASIGTVLSKTNLSKDVKDLIINYYGILGFNVPYTYNQDTKQYTEIASNELPNTERAHSYLKSINDLQDFSDEIDKILRSCAAAFMYMDIYNSTKKMDLNIVYLIGGFYYAASAMLQKVLDEAESLEKAFNISHDFKRDRTIVDALNDGARGTAYNAQAVAQIILTSSFNFGRI